MANTVDPTASVASKPVKVSGTANAPILSDGMLARAAACDKNYSSNHHQAT
jgi:hypothetical protein